MFAASSASRFCKCLVLSILTVLFCCAIALAQNAEPSRTQCKQWDDSYLFLFNLFLLAGIFLPLVLNVSLPPLLGRRLWFLTAPRVRIFSLTLIVAVVLTTVFVALPFVIGFGRFIFSGIDQTYFNCETVKFGATGLLFGLIGVGIAAISQWLALLILLIISSALGALIALIVSELLAASIGLSSRVRGGNA
jgi:hypothetical protein